MREGRSPKERQAVPNWSAEMPRPEFTRRRREEVETVRDRDDYYADYDMPDAYEHPLTRREKKQQKKKSASGGKNLGRNMNERREIKAAGAGSAELGRRNAEAGIYAAAQRGGRNRARQG